MSKKKSGVMIALVAVSAAVATLTTLAVLAVRFVQKKKQEECGEVFDYTFDGNEIENCEEDGTFAREEENAAEDIPTDQ